MALIPEANQNNKGTAAKKFLDYLIQFANIIATSSTITVFEEVKMPWYLTNVEKTEEIKNAVAQAAKAVGKDVRFLDHPVPADGFNDDLFFDLLGEPASYSYEAACKMNYGSIAVFDESADLSDFWKEYDGLTKSKN